jgi:hypothetical protein
VNECVQQSPSISKSFVAAKSQDPREQWLGRVVGYSAGDVLNEADYGKAIDFARANTGAKRR